MPNKYPTHHDFEASSAFLLSGAFVILLLFPCLSARAEVQGEQQTNDTEAKGNLSIQRDESAALSTIAFDRRYLGEEVLFETDFSNAEPEAFPANLIAVTGNMLVREYDGKKALHCFQHCKFGVELPKSLGSAYSIEIEAVDNSQPEYPFYPTINIFISEESRNAASKGSAPRAGSVELACNSEMHIESRPFFLPIIRETGGRRSNDLRSVSTAGIALDGKLLRTFLGTRQTLVIPQRDFVGLTDSRELLFWTSSAQVVIRHIRVTRLTLEQSEALGQATANCSNVVNADGNGGGRVILEESFDSVCAGAFPVRTDIDQRGTEGAVVVDFENRRWMAWSDLLLIHLPDTLPSNFVIEFTALFFPTPTDARSYDERSISLWSWQSSDLIQRIIMQEVSAGKQRIGVGDYRLRRGVRAGVVLQSPGKSGLGYRQGPDKGGGTIRFPGGELPQGIPTGRPFECKLVSAGSNLKVFVDGELAATATNAKGSGADVLCLSVKGSLRAQVLWTGLKVY